MALSSRRSDTDMRAPIEWDCDRETVNKILTYCEEEVNNVRRQRRKGSRVNHRHLDAREAILERIYGNLQNITHRAYPAAITFDKVETALTRPFLPSAPPSDASPDQLEQHNRRQLQLEHTRIGLVAALESEWARARAHFLRNFPKHDPD